MLDIDVPGPFGGVQQALVYSVKDHTSVRAVWRNPRPGKGGGKGLQPSHNPKSSARGCGKSGLTAEALRKHTEEMSAVEWSQVASKRKRVGAPRHS